jgi:hypothetical protein
MVIRAMTRFVMVAAPYWWKEDKTENEPLAWFAAFGLDWAMPPAGGLAGVALPCGHGRAAIIAG